MPHKPDIAELAWQVIDGIIAISVERQKLNTTASLATPELLNREQAADHLSVGTTIFDELRRENAFPEVAIRGKPRFRRSDLDKYIRRLKPR